MISANCEIGIWRALGVIDLDSDESAPHRLAIRAASALATENVVALQRLGQSDMPPTDADRIQHVARIDSIACKSHRGEL